VDDQLVDGIHVSPPSAERHGAIHEDFFRELFSGGLRSRGGFGIPVAPAGGLEGGLHDLSGSPDGGVHNFSGGLHRNRDEGTAHGADHRGSGKEEVEGFQGGGSFHAPGRLQVKAPRSLSPIRRARLQTRRSPG